MLNFKNLMFAKWNDNLKRLHCYTPTRPYAPKSVVPSPYEPQRKTLLNSQRKKPLYDWCIQSIFFFFNGVHAFFFQLDKYAIVFMRHYPNINRNHQNLCEKLWCLVRFETIIPLETSGGLHRAAEVDIVGICKGFVDRHGL